MIELTVHLVAADAADDVAVDAGGGDNLNDAAGARRVRSAPAVDVGPQAVEQEAAEAGEENCGGGTAHGKTSDLLLRSVSNSTESNPK